jgi:hypothetical protein
MSRKHPNRKPNKRSGGYNPRCALCNKFMSWKDMDEGVRWSPYGDGCVFEPPEEEYAHLRCWDAASQDRRDLIKAISWSGPHIPQQEAA